MMSHNVDFHGEIKKVSILFGLTPKMPRKNCNRGHWFSLYFSEKISLDI